MKGYRTVIVNILMLVASVGVLWGIEITPEQIDSIATGLITVFTVANLILRAVTSTPIGKKEPPAA
jgi:hypothetical protein